LQNNQSLDKIDLSDNELKDKHGIFILKYIKIQAERRDNDLWELGLRQRRAEGHLQKLTKCYNMQNIYEDRFG
jgi:hypothetical protein